jgi:hypothetical protein
MRINLVSRVALTEVIPVKINSGKFFENLSQKIPNKSDESIRGIDNEFTLGTGRQN